ncbi:hypothetical protein [Bacteroides sp.]
MYVVTDGRQQLSLSYRKEEVTGNGLRVTSDEFLSVQTKGCRSLRPVINKQIHYGSTI